jgi:hypothetical protein
MNEYTDSDGGTQQFVVGHRSLVISQSSLVIDHWTPAISHSPLAPKAIQQMTGDE